MISIKSLPPHESVNMKSFRRGFTLIELLAVIGIIALFVGLIGQAMRDEPGGTGLTGAQGAISGLVNLARSQAALTQGNGRTVDSIAAQIIVYAAKTTDADVEKYMRQIQIVVPDPASPNTKWISKGDPVILPVGIYIVPPSPVPVADGVTWPDGRDSRFNVTTQPATLTVDDISGSYYQLTFTMLNTMSGTNGLDNPVRIVLSVGKPRIPGSSETDPVKFTNPENVRGLRFSQYGVQIPLNDALDFPSQ